MANYKCKNDETHTQTVTATVTSSTTAATCETAGSTAYSATVTAASSLDSTAHTDSKNVSIAALGHDWSMTYEWAGDHKSLNATFVCTRNASHTRTVVITDDIESAVTTAPTATNPGVRTYSVEFVFDGKTYNASDTEEIPATGSAVNGTILSFGTEAEIEITLTRKGETVAAYETVATENGSYYEFREVTAGTYIMTVKKDKHATRTYELAVATTGATQNIEIYLVGDITGDGKVTTIDFARAYMHAQHIESEDEYTKYELTGYAFACADVNGDGKVTTADAGMINSHVRGGTPLWQ